MSLITTAAISILFGGTFAAGLICMLASAPRWRVQPLSVRIAPYVRDAVTDEVLPAGSLPHIGVLPSGFWPWLRTRFSSALGGSHALAARLAQSGSSIDAASFRGRQLAWALVGFAGGAVLVVVLALSGRITPPAFVLPLLLAAAAVVIQDVLLTSRVRARMHRLSDELPTTLEFLALCLSAGEGLLDALRRVAGVGSGELARELQQLVLAVSTGSPLAEALADLSRRIPLPALGRANDQIIAALEHGAPLAGVLHAQANDARDEAKRTLIEQAGRREIYMLLPLVFLILPLSVLFAVFPGLLILRLGLG